MIEQNRRELLAHFLAGSLDGSCIFEKTQQTLRTEFGNIVHKYQLGTSEKFRELLKSCHAVISGSQALVPFSYFFFGDLDLYAPLSSQDELHRYLEGKNFFRSSPSSNLYRRSPSIVTVHRYHRDGFEYHIDVVYSSNSSALAPIAEFFSTVPMNFIAHHGVVSLYPALTLAGRGLINDSSTNSQESITKYTQRGFSFGHSLKEWDTYQYHSCMEDPSCAFTFRLLYDSGVLHIPFDEVSRALHRHQVSFTWRLNTYRHCISSPRDLVAPGFTISYKAEFG